MQRVETPFRETEGEFSLFKDMKRGSSSVSGYSHLILFASTHTSSFPAKKKKKKKGTRAESEYKTSEVEFL